MSRAAATKSSEPTLRSIGETFLKEYEKTPMQLRVRPSVIVEMHTFGDAVPFKLMDWFFRVKFQVDHNNFICRF